MSDFYVTSDLPEPFRAADLLMAKKYPTAEKVKHEPEDVPDEAEEVSRRKTIDYLLDQELNGPPIKKWQDEHYPEWIAGIKSDYEIAHPFPGDVEIEVVRGDVTPSKKDIKRLKKLAKAQRQAEIDMIQLVTRKNMLRRQLGDLSIKRKKDAKKIAAINIQLKQIDIAIADIESEFGVKITEIDRGTKVGRFLGKIKRAAKRFFKKTKKFYKRNMELINGLAAIIVPVVGGLIVKSIVRA